MTSTFLFRAFLGSLGRFDIIRLSVCVRMMLFSNTGSIKGAMSSRVPQRAEPYSRFFLNFLAFLPLKYTTSRIITAAAIPTSRSIGWKLGTMFSNAIEMPCMMFIALEEKSTPGERRAACPSFVARSPMNTYGILRKNPFTYLEFQRGKIQPVSKTF